MDIPDAKYEEIDIDAENIGNFVMSEHHRILRPSAVSRLVSHLNKGESFKNQMHVNLLKNSKMRIVDGGHRLAALQDFIRSDDGATAKKIKIAVYSGLTVDQERELYSILARTVTETINDMIKRNFDTIPIFLKIDQNFPINTSIYGHKESISFANLLRVWKSRELSSLLSLSRDYMLTYARSLNNDDYVLMKEFFNTYIKMFGKPMHVSPYYKTGPLWIISSVYFRNIGVVDKAKLLELLRRKLFNNTFILDASRNHGTQAHEDTRRVLIERLNQGWRGNKLV